MELSDHDGDIVNAILSLDQKLVYEQSVIPPSSGEQVQITTTSEQGGLPMCEYTRKKAPKPPKTSAERMGRGRPAGSRRQKRWLNRRLLEANLRRALYDSGEDILESENYCHGSYNQVVVCCGKKGYSGFGAKDIPMRKIPTCWTQLREDLEASRLFRHRKEDDLFVGCHLDHEIHSEDFETDDDIIINNNTSKLQAFLEQKIFNAFRASKRTIVKREGFIINYLEDLERVFLTYLSTWREEAASAGESSALNIFKLERNGSSLQQIQPLEETPLHRSFRLHYPNALLIWNPSGIHRKMTYLLCSVWDLLCHSRAISNNSICNRYCVQPSTGNRRAAAAVQKVVIIQVEGPEVRIPVFPVAMNLINILTKPAKATLKIRSPINSGIASDVEEGLIPASWY